MSNPKSHIPMPDDICAEPGCNERASIWGDGERHGKDRTPHCDEHSFVGPCPATEDGQHRWTIDADTLVCKRGCWVMPYPGLDFQTGTYPDDICTVPGCGKVAFVADGEGGFTCEEHTPSDHYLLGGRNDVVDVWMYEAVLAAERAGVRNGDGDAWRAVQRGFRISEEDYAAFKAQLSPDWTPTWQEDRP